MLTIDCSCYATHAVFCIMDFSGFFDLSVNITALKDSEKLFKRLYDFGYRTVAVNTVVEESVLQTKSDKKRKGGSNIISNSDIVPLPQVVDLPEDLKGKLRILNRLTIEFSDPNQLVKFRQSENLKKYNLLAALPKSDSALQRTCISLDFDIISFSPLEKPVRFNRKMYNLAVSKNVCFEMPYSPMLLSSTARRNSIQTGHGYHALGRSKNIILTSGAEHYMQIRGPYDVANLGLLFGLSLEQSKRAVTAISRQAILKGDGRRFGNAVMVIAKVDKSSDVDDVMDVDDDSPAKKRLRNQSLEINS